ncbi:acyl-CoA oxidase [Auricularia subglabra TFB-10046 SS5]|uniref:Acyl-coenzyme A oxidase n=1 Tax=Auricularia subglabra (strain TFB-10046 / SS5) TaxID=717982 RepID=J0D9X4_AURST|nr:acyl-CoA oxidase [Auricularia subglabra TFB-10046 SS5]
MASTGVPLEARAQARADMARARSRTSFDIVPVRHWLHGDAEAWENHAQLVRIVSHEAVVNLPGRPFMSREERYANGQAIINRFNELRIQNQWSDEQLERALLVTGQILPSSLHATAFQPVILRQGSDEQIRLWGPAISARAIIGCYAQTELGHGTDVAALETTATFDPKTDEFVLHSPTLTSTKWWIGGLGRTATHAVVQAQLHLQGKALGPHLFFVQLRSLEDHSTLPGRTIGDIGPKALGAHQAVDHGFLRFDSVRIPRFNMLSKFAKVTREGQYVQPPHAKLVYGGMLYIRAQMNHHAVWLLGKAITISIRYCTIRRQGKVGADGLAPQVISYPSTYYRLLPILANAYVFNAIAHHLHAEYEAMSALLARGDASLLPEVHIALAAMKVLVSTDALAGLDIARRAMGGHGFSEFAGGGRLLADHTPAVTYEGDNYVLDKQVVRAAVKGHQMGVQLPAESLSVFAFLGQLAAPMSAPVSARDLAQTLRYRAANVVKNFAQLKDSTQDPGAEARVSRAVGDAYVAGIAANALEQGLPGGEPVHRLFLLHLLTTVESALADLPNVDSRALRAHIGAACADILPDAIGLTDAFGFTDWELDSALGVYDGAVYDALWERASKSGFNAASPHEKEYKAHIMAILERGRKEVARL